jgi:hypothetical protein
VVVFGTNAELNMIVRDDRAVAASSADKVINNHERRGFAWHPRLISLFRRGTGCEKKNRNNKTGGFLQHKYFVVSAVCL